MKNALDLDYRQIWSLRGLFSRTSYLKWGEMMRVLKQFRAEILALILLLSGIFSLTDRMRLVDGIAHLTARISRNVSVALSLFSTFFKSVLSNPSNILGLTLILVAVLMLAKIWTRESLINSSTYSSRRCPVCNEKLVRAHRKPLDHLIGLFMPLRRYECSNYKCGWSGRRVTARRHGYSYNLH